MRCKSRPPTSVFVTVPGAGRFQLALGLERLQSLWLTTSRAPISAPLAGRRGRRLAHVLHSRTDRPASRRAIPTGGQVMDGPRQSDAPPSSGWSISERRPSNDECARSRLVARGSSCQRDPDAGTVPPGHRRQGIARWLSETTSFTTSQPTSDPVRAKRCTRASALSVSGPARRDDWPA